MLGTLWLAIQSICSFILTALWWFVTLAFRLAKGVYDGLRDPDWGRGLFKCVVNCLGLVVYCLVIVLIVNLPNLKQLMSFGSVITTLAQDEIIVYDGPSEFYEDGYGTGSFGGMEYEIDLNKVPSKVDLPSNYYQAGTPLQRAELLLLVQEICARPEIDLTPQELLGVMYVECTGYLNPSIGSIVHNTYPESYNGAGAGGPMQHLKVNWWNEGDNQVSGKTFISRLENASLSDEQRVKKISESVNLTTPDGYGRPNMFYFPDALYSSALRISEGKVGRYNGNKDGVTLPVLNWSEDKSDSDFIRYNAAVSRYSGYVKDCCSTWIPHMYHSLVKQKGAIAQWSDLAISRKGLISAFVGDGYNGPGGFIESIKMEPVDTPEPLRSTKSSYLEYWKSVGKIHQPSHYYAFAGINGGTWMYQGLCALGDAIGSNKKPGQGSGGAPPGFGTWIYPLDFDSFYVTAPYNEDRGSYSHKGIDIDTGTGDNLYALQTGTVIKAGWDSACTNSGNYNTGGGKIVAIRFENGYEAWYMHLDQILCEVGDEVKAGDVIGLSGNTGGSTGDHLHLEIRKGGVHFNPTFIFADKISNK